MIKLLSFFVLTTLPFGVLAADKKVLSPLPKLVDLGASKCIPFKK